ncbi:hypothetical protein RRF57_001532 [Xylaria bambusicola]|uniref:Hypervirulence associated protein TUDOR domain-containing protein n=1 Tax=Xylaria bambusicola TaxID=326684 RepID=A0AAN7UHD9_9PEZI
MQTLTVYTTTVSWNWGGGAPGGTVAETKDEGEIAIKSKRGNTVKKNASPDNPAVHVERSGNDVVKRASELTVELKSSKNRGKYDDDDNENSGSKRKADKQDGVETDSNEDENEAEEAGDADDAHTTNKQGKEVKKGGKAANKKQKTRQDEDVRGKSDAPDASKEETDEAVKEDISEDDDNEGDGANADEDADGEEDQKRTQTTKRTSDVKKGATKGKQEDRKPARTSGQSKAKAHKDPTPRQDGDQVSTRTRSQQKAD